jgi:hypothetical protein
VWLVIILIIVGVRSGTSSSATVATETRPLPRPGL